MKRLFTPHSKKVIFFDLNRTLIDPKRTFRKHFIDLLEAYTGRWAASASFQAEQIVHQYEREWIRRKRSNKRLKRNNLRHLTLTKVLKPYPFDLSKTFTTQFFKQLTNRQRKEPILYSEAIPTLKQLRQSYELAIISNSSLIDLEKLGLSQLIREEHVFTASICGARKPSPIIFRTALKKMRIKANEAVMVGNSWHKDIQGSLSCGMDAVWIRATTTQRMRKVRKTKGKMMVQIKHVRELDTLF